MWPKLLIFKNNFSHNKINLGELLEPMFALINPKVSKSNLMILKPNNFILLMNLEASY